MDFGHLIKRSWTITWRYKALWVLGVFAGVSGCQGGGSSNSSSRNSTGGGEEFDSFWQAIQPWVPAIIAGVVALFVLGLVLWVLGIAARGGLIVGVDEIEQGRERPLRELWGVGFGSFGRLLGLDLVLVLPMLVLGLGLAAAVMVPVFGPLVAGRDPGPEALVPICGVLAVGVPLLMVVSFVVGIVWLLAQRFIMLGGQGVFESAASAWRLMRDRLKDTVLLYLLNAALNIAASFVVTIPIVLIGVAIAVPVIAAAASERWSLMAVPIALGLLVIMALSALYNGVWGTYTSSLWTLGYRQLTQPVQTPSASAESPVFPQATPSPAPVTPEQPPADA